MIEYLQVSGSGRNGRQDPVVVIIARRLDPGCKLAVHRTRLAAAPGSRILVAETFRTVSLILDDIPMTAPFFLVLLAAIAAPAPQANRSDR